MKLCLACKHCCFEPGSPAYSELTPGEDTRLECELGLWSIKSRRETKETLQSKLFLAETCKDFTPEGTLLDVLENDRPVEIIETRHIADDGHVYITKTAVNKLRPW